MENISVGLAAENYNLDCLPGRSCESIAFQSNDGYLYHQSERGMRFADSVRQGDVIGCGINYPTHLRSNEAQVYFTHNGKKIGSVVTVRLPQRGTLFATIALGYSEDKVRVFIGPKSEKSWRYKKMRMHYKCQYQARCREVVEALKVPERLLDAEWNRCYCSKCYNEEDVYLRGNPPKRYGMPKGWVRFGIKVDNRQDAKDIFNSYHVAFRGTSWDAVKQILDSGQLLLPGDTSGTGFKIPLPKGHIQDGNASLVPVAQKPNHYKVEPKHPKGCKCNCELFLPTKLFFASPSIKYCEHEAYAGSGFKFSDHHFKTVFQLRLKPGSYKVLAETIGAKLEKVNELTHFSTTARWNGAQTHGILQW